MKAAKTAAPRSTPALVTYLQPFRIVADDGDQSWNVTIEQVNRGIWDYVKLHEIVGGIDVGLESPYHMIVCFDGGLALPPIPELRSVPRAVEFFNRCLGALLLGGIYCEAVTLDHIETGRILDWKYLRANFLGDCGRYNGRRRRCRSSYRNRFQVCRDFYGSCGSVNFALPTLVTALCDSDSVLALGHPHRRWCVPCEVAVQFDIRTSRRRENFKGCSCCRAVIRWPSLRTN